MHKRLVQYLSPGKEPLPGQTAETLDVILFYWDTHLRSHAVFHLANFTEISDWKKVSRIDLPVITKNIDRIKDIGCPFFLDNTRRPPCYSNSGNCRKWKQCTTYAAQIENSYLDCCRKVIEDGCTIPMLAVFQNNEGEKNFWAMGHNKIAALCSLINGTYTLKTSYRPKQGAHVTWKESRDFLISKVLFESSGNPRWITDETWGVARENENRNQRKNSKRNKRNKGKRRGRKW
jgi:hypothetical protein